MINLTHVHRTFLISDTHLGVRANSTEWLTYIKKWFYEDFIPTIKANWKPGDILIHCGDFFDNRQSINLLVLSEAIALFEELSKLFPDGIYILAGNHDVMKKTSNDITSLDSLKYIPNVHIIKEPILIKFKSAKALLMPWRTNSIEEQMCIESFTDENLDYIFCHTNITSLHLDKNREVEEGLDLTSNKFKRVYSGHIHWAQKRGNIRMLGCPYQLTRSDAGNPKGCYLLDFTTDEEMFFENRTSARFIKLYLDKITDYSIEHLTSLCQGNFVDLYVPSEYLIKYQITKLIDILSTSSIKLDIIPFEPDDILDSTELNESIEHFSLIGLCKTYVNKLSAFDEKTKERLYNKIESLYTTITRDNK